LLQASRRAQKNAGMKGHLHMTTTERYAHITQSDLRATIALFAQRGQQLGNSSSPPLGST
jgi:hypothetical protein